MVWKTRKGDDDDDRAKEVGDGGWGHWGSWAQDDAQWGKSPMPLVVGAGRGHRFACLRRVWRWRWVVEVVVLLWVPKMWLMVGVVVGGQ